jgi:flagellar motor switch/type III secretory pathway protein FliN
MIADALFDASPDRVRRLRFVPRPSIPIEAACLVANGIRETVRELLGESCELVLGEPAAIAGDAWSLLVRDAFLFVTRGRQTDVVLVVPQRDARRLVLRAFGEGEALSESACSALELAAIERIAARCAATFDPLCAERTGISRPISAHDVPPCVAYFDVRVHAPIALALGIGIVRDLPDPGPSGALDPRALDRVRIPVRAVVAHGTLDAASLVALRPGDLVPLETPLDGGATLTVGGRPFASGICGALGSRGAFLVGEALVGTPA